MGRQAVNLSELAGFQTLASFTGAPARRLPAPDERAPNRHPLQAT
jgi:hypothetical protein